MYDGIPVKVEIVSYSRWKVTRERRTPLDLGLLVNEFVLRRRPPLEGHLIGDDQIPMDPRDLLIRMRYVLFPTIW
jgi:hypothetical protein